MNCQFILHSSGVWACGCCGAASRVYTAATQRNCPRPCIRGLGDVVAAVLWTVGVRRKCGACRRRQARLNALFPARKKLLGKLPEAIDGQ